MPSQPTLTNGFEQTFDPQTIEILVGSASAVTLKDTGGEAVVTRIIGRDGNPYVVKDFTDDNVTQQSDPANPALKLPNGKAAELLAPSLSKIVEHLGITVVAASVVYEDKRYLVTRYVDGPTWDSFAGIVYGGRIREDAKFDSERLAKFVATNPITDVEKFRVCSREASAALEPLFYKYGFKFQQSHFLVQSAAIKENGELAMTLVLIDLK